MKSIESTRGTGSLTAVLTIALWILLSVPSGGAQTRRFESSATETLDLGRQAMLMALLISGPVLGVGMLVGLLISLIQTVTQIQDQTLSMVPKIVAMVATAIFFVPWLAQRVVEFSQEMFGTF